MNCVNFWIDTTEYYFMQKFNCSSIKSFFLINPHHCSYKTQRSLCYPMLFLQYLNTFYCTLDFIKTTARYSASKTKYPERFFWGYLGKSTENTLIIRLSYVIEFQVILLFKFNYLWQRFVNCSSTVSHANSVFFGFQTT